VVARNEEEWCRCGRLLPDHLEEPFPEILHGRRIVKDVTCAQDRVHGLPSRHAQDPGHNIQSRARELLLRLFWKHRESSPEVPVGRVDEPQHDVFAADVIRNVARNSGVTVGVSYRSAWY
jgi:hypothetical protein